VNRQVTSRSRRKALGCCRGTEWGSGRHGGTIMVAKNGVLGSNEKIRTRKRLGGRSVLNKKPSGLWAGIPKVVGRSTGTGSKLATREEWKVDTSC